jgi:hypothetical protein
MGLSLTLLLVLASAVILRSESRGTHENIFTVLDSRLQPGGPGPRIYISHEQSGPVIPPGTGLLMTSIYHIYILVYDTIIAYFPFTVY